MDEFTSIGDGLSKKYFSTSIANSSSKAVRKPSIDEVDATANEIVAAYKTLSYRKWYCQLCNKLGIHTVRSLMARASDARQPARLFSVLAKKAEQEYDARQARNGS